MRSRIEQWVMDVASLCHPRGDPYVCSGKEEESERLADLMCRENELIRLNPRSYPNSFLYRSAPHDVARTENVTYICSSYDPGPTNNHMDPLQGRAMIKDFFPRIMEGKTMYVIPVVLGSLDDPRSPVFVEATDSPYVALNIHRLYRVISLDAVRFYGPLMFGLHALGNCDPEKRFIPHFPETLEVFSVNTGFGGNSILPKKSGALRLGSYCALKEGWLAEHMALLDVEDPDGEITRFAIAAPSSCGKTNMAMLQETPSLPGWRVRTICDDLARLFVGEDGSLRATAPESGFFAVIRNNSLRTNPNMIHTIRKGNAIFTNAALTSREEPWWDGCDTDAPKGLVDWQGRAWHPKLGDASHKNARVTVRARQCPTLSDYWESDDAKGVPISGIIYAVRRPEGPYPLLFEAFDYDHGQFWGFCMRTETTSAIADTEERYRFDSYAMQPFCGYHMGEFADHRIAIGKQLRNPPRIFQLNLFRQSRDQKFLWPGPEENLHLLKWMVDRIRGRVESQATPLGFMPYPRDIDYRSIRLAPSAMEELTRIDVDGWREELSFQNAYLERFGSRLPLVFRNEYKILKKNLDRHKRMVSV